jgi:hypothetical protein
MELRRLREAAGVTIEQVAERLECSTSKISRIETGQTGVTPRDVRDIATVYGVPEQAVEELLLMAREARLKGWWQLYGPVLTSAYVGLEQGVDAVQAYEALVVPGLLQTQDYARAMTRAGRPDFDDNEIDKRVRIRMNRHSLITQENPIDLWVVLDEAVLRRPVGGRSVMRQQLDHLVKVAGLPNVTLQVLPFSVGAHAAMDGTFSILIFRESASQNFVFASNAAGGLFLEKEEELRRYSFIFDHLRSNALPTDESARMIAGLAEEI